MAKLAAYRAKRNFDRTAEPEGSDDGGPADGFAFVIQKHDATRLHYDLRLELDGVMKSWAVTKGPSLVPGEKRLSVHVEDHPVEYNSFEGTIPDGQYGGGTVLLWDRGRWEPEGDPNKGYAKGHLAFRLHGEKLRGGWHLVRMRRKPREKQEGWLLIKSEDEAARMPEDPDVLEEQPRSVASGRTMEEIAADPKGRVWDSSTGEAADARAERAAGGSSAGSATHAPHAEVPRAAGPRSTRNRPASFEARLRRAPQDEDVERLSPPSQEEAVQGSRKGRGAEHRPATAKPKRMVAKTKGRTDASDPGPGTETAPDLPALAAHAPKAAMPKAVEPCLATLASAVPRGDKWLHEIKWDGYRLLAFKTAGGVRLATRRGLDWTWRFPAIAEAVAALPVPTAILDGEAVIEDENGLSSFSAMQTALSDDHGKIARAAIFYAFDLLYLDGHDLRPLPLEDRKARLAALVPAGEPGALRLGEHLEADGAAMVRSACGLGLEGVISKRRDRPYRSGRSDEWVKVKCTERQEFVVVGFVPSAASTKAIGSLVLAYNEEGGLRLAGRSGTGYAADVARALRTRLKPHERRTPPLARKPTPEEKRGVVWTEPVLVAEVEFRGWTGDDHLRHAAFKGLREDKAPSEVVRERPRDLPKALTDGTPAATTRTAKPARHGAASIAGVTLTHPERVLWPDAGVTKQDLAEFYEAIAAHLLPQIVDRPLSLVRCPGGTDGTCFFQKHSWAGLSEHVLRETVRDEGGEEEVLFVRDIAGVVSLVQASVLEIHPWGATMADVDRADRIVMDLDPGEGVPFADVMAGAREVRERLSALGLESFVKTTGGKGLHVVVPLTGPAPWPAVKAFAKSLSDAMEKDAPDRFIAKATRSARRGVIYVDYLRNGRGATAVAAYSTRARPGATVAVPLAWDELTPALEPGGFTVATLPARLSARTADPWEAMTSCRQALPAGGPTRRRSARSRRAG